MDDNASRSAAAKPAATASKPSPSESSKQQPRPLYSSKLGDGKTRSSENVASSPTTRTPPVTQKAWTSAKNPITGRSPQTPQQNSFGSSANKQSSTNSLREGQRVRIALRTGAEYEGIYANIQADPSSFSLRMVQQRKSASDMANGTNGANKREQSSMSFSRKDVVEARPLGGPGKIDSKVQNGNRPGFRTDAAISTIRQGSERELQPWTPDGAIETGGSLEKPSGQESRWDQFAVNERLFGVKTDYDENIYTTAINRSDPQYKQRAAAAERTAREIERSVPTTAHVAEERVMDFTGGEDKGGEEEDKYSGVCRRDFPPTSNNNKYTPPARRAPTGSATAYGAPVDPAIISSQLKGPPATSPAAQKGDDTKSPNTSPNVPSTPQAADARNPELKAELNDESKASQTDEAVGATTDSKPIEKAGDSKAAAALRPSAVAGRAVSPQTKTNAGGATSTVEHDVLKEFKSFAVAQRAQAEKVRNTKAKADAHVKLQELKKFGATFKLATPVPSDLIPIIAKDPAKQKKIQEKAMQNAEEVAKSRVVKEKEIPTPTKEASKGPKEPSAPAPAVAATAPHATPENRNPSRPPHTHGLQSTNQSQRHQGPRPSYTPGGGYNNNGQFRGDRSSGQYGGPPRNPLGGNLAERLRRLDRENNRPVPGTTQQQQQQVQQAHHPQQFPPQLQQQPPQHVGPDQRQPPTGPASAMDSSFNRRLGSVSQAPNAKLNPNSHEFRPNPFATTFNPNVPGPSNGASPRLSVNNAVEALPTAAPVAGRLIRRKTKSIDIKKCFILAHIKTFSPQEGRNWDDNGGLRPSYDTLPTWRQLKDDELADSTMHMTYTQYLEKHASGAMATPTPPHVMPQMPHQHQLPFHLQHGAHGLAPRQSPHLPPMQMHGSGQPHGHVPHVSFSGADDHRMMHSNSAQSYASPRMAPVAIGFPPPTMSSPAQMPYTQAAMPPFMPSTPHANNFRSFSGNPQFMPQQNSPMAMQVMPQQFLPAPNAIIPGGPQMPMYAPGMYQPFVAAGGNAPPQQIPGSNGGYPSPGRSAAPMMAQQGSQQGQPMYGVSPSMQFQQPVFQSQHPGHMNMRGVYNGAGPQQFGTSPQQMHQYGPQHRTGSNNYSGNKTYQGHGGPHQVAPQGHVIPSGPQGRQPEGPEDSK